MTSREREAAVAAGVCLLILFPLTASSSSDPSSSSLRGPEAFFLNGSSFAIIAGGAGAGGVPEQLAAGAKIALSFRTCLPGELLRQTGRRSLDQLQLRLDPAGRLVLAITAADRRLNLVVSGTKSNRNLLDGLWHTAEVKVTTDGSKISLTVTASSGEENRQEQELDGLLEVLDLSGSQLRVGAGMIACIREGPGVRFTRRGTEVSSYAVDWDGCLLPYTCQGYDWAAMRDDGGNCATSVCHNGGVCAYYANNNATHCLCPPGWSGADCNTPASSCADQPCANGAECVDDADNGGYTCYCPGEWLSGRHCQNEAPAGTLASCRECLNGAECLLAQPTSGGATPLCECASGYAGDRCEERTSARLQSPCVSADPYCLNNGTCLFSVKVGATCLCSEGFSGARCECPNCGPNASCRQSQCKCNPGFSGTPPSTPCLPSTTPPVPCSCLNGGSCAGSLCICPPGFTGPRCQNADDGCSPVRNPCQNGATCRVLTAGPGGVECLCAPGFRGIYCNDDVDECQEGNPCANNGQCQNYDGGYRCQCTPGWTGHHCEDIVGDCSSDPCANGGVCQDLPNGDFTCQCASGFTGRLCEINIDECSSSPCLNGGSCTNLIDGFQCACSPRFMGETCASPYDPCEAAGADGGCLNGGVCRPLKEERDPGKDFFCQCAEGFDGLRCENDVDDCIGATCPPNQVCIDLTASYECRTLPIDDCAGAPCLNGGICSPRSGGGFYCACPDGWQGETCSQDVDECAKHEGLCNNGICRNKVGTYECYCRPGFSGSHCNYEFDECLSRPCANGGSCTNLVNGYECHCPPGFKGVNCEINIDECDSNPCLNGAACVDGINNYTCSCIPGFAGRNCQINIDECEPKPCLHGGQCKDGINSYECICAGTGFEGQHCELNIDECASNPCMNNATCVDAINNYTCVCFDGYEGKNCSKDVAECAETPGANGEETGGGGAGPCLNGALCFERSNVTLYDPAMRPHLPQDVRDVFGVAFSYERAAGYVCSCMPGYEGPNCEIDIDECAGNPCLHGECVDGIAQYECLCDAGYEGTNCEVEIDECDRYAPCQHGACMDRIADYECTCEPGYGGKNCSVSLTGCQDVVCLNGGTCTPWLVGETDHRANCSCTSGFDGLRCQSRTTFSLNGQAYIKVPSDRLEGYELHMKFRTTIGNGLVAIGQGNTHFSLQLREGKLNLHSNLISKFEGILIGENLNNTAWQKVYVAVNSSHLTLGVNDQLQATQPINPTGENDTVFFNTFLGGIVRDQQILANNAPAFIGCIQDITVNAMKITEEDFKDGVGRDVEQVETNPGCPREEQCDPNPCRNEGFCTDLWSNYQCTCHRPFLGPSCQFNYTGATFGYENVTSSMARVDIENPAPFRSGVDISMFIRTRELDGFIFYLGSELTARAVTSAEQRRSYITGQLVQGNLVVNVYFEGKRERFQVYTVDLSDGFRHFIRVVRMNNSMMVKVNETVSINHEIPSPTSFAAEKLYLGNFPDLAAESTESSLSESTTVESPLPSSLPPSSPLSAVPFATTFSTISTEAAEHSSSSSIDTTLPLGGPSITESSLPLPNDIEHGGGEQQAADVVLNGDREDFVPTTAAAGATLDEDTSSLELASQEPRVLNRFKREESSTAADLLEEERPRHFKGVIQDIQITNGRNVTRIVELFEFNFGDQEVERPPSIGPVTLTDVMEGVVSDDTCKVSPCSNGGTCQVTWNDYHCQCPPGFRGHNCDEKEYCYWYRCPADSECRSLSDGHECVANATFNGVNSSVFYSPEFASSSVDLVDSTLRATFRTKRPSTTLLHVYNNGSGLFIRLAVNDDGTLTAEIPENGSPRALLVANDVTDGLWHTVEVSFDDRGGVSASLDGEADIELSYDSTVTDLGSFVSQSRVVVGASRVDESQMTNFFRGCIGEIRVGGVLLPFFTEEQLVNSTAGRKFVVSQVSNVAASGAECVLCYQHECANGGVCANPDTEFECRCPEGFEDPLCATNIDECVESECRNGICVDQVAGYKCECTIGWTGAFCEEDLDECLSQPCQHNGTCQQTAVPGNYTCACPPDYEGHSCEEVKIKTCDHSPCLNGGSCRPGRNAYTDDLYICDCLTLYRGIDCEVKKDFCEENEQPCRNGATCVSVDSLLNYKCHCPPGYTGDLCAEEIDECASDPCQNGGKCLDSLNSYACDCSNTGFEGDVCQTNVDECSRDAPCVNNGTCTDTDGDYNCTCPQPFCGKNCQNRDPCQLEQNLCQNDGVCQPACDESPLFYKCDCPKEWTGQNCTDKLVDLASVSDEDDDLSLTYILAPLVGGMSFLLIVGLLVFISMAKKQRSMHGKYNPQKQEYHAPRLELEMRIKPPAEERLI